MIGHLIYNYEHNDDILVQQELSKKLYADTFTGVHLVHSYNGDKKVGYKKYLEDKLIHIKNSGHFQGACDLINAGLTYFNQNKIKNLRYVIVTAADTWAYDTKFLKNIIDRMASEGKVLAASSWGRSQYPAKPTGISTDFFVIDIEWNRKAKLFPLNYKSFVKKYSDIFYLQYSIPIVEVAVQYNYAKYFGDHYVDNEKGFKRDNFFLRIIEREPVHDLTGKRVDDWPKIGLFTNPVDVRSKQKFLQNFKYNFGKYTEKLIKSKSLSYYNKAEKI